MSVTPPLMLADAWGGSWLVPAIEQNKLGLGVGLAVLLVGLLGVGLRDVRRLRLGRATAIAGVCFTEAMRRRVLWITPLAMLGVIGVSRFVIGEDAADTLRQVTKYCFFASGLVAVAVGIVLACTNLPRDLESKVIFTIVTKPATRLEVVLGKVIGFSLVSAAVLGVMAAFTVIYLSVLAGGEQRSIAAQLEGGAEPGRRGELMHYANVGLLTTRTLVPAEGAQLYAAEPEGDTVFLSGLAGQDAVVPFRGGLEAFRHPDDTSEGDVFSRGVVVLLDLDFAAADGSAANQPPTVVVDFLDGNQFQLVPSAQMPAGGAVQLRDDGTALLRLPAEIAADLAEAGEFLARVRPLGSPRLGFDTSGTPVRLAVPGKPRAGAAQVEGKLIRPAGAAVMRGRAGRFGQHLVGPIGDGADAQQQVAVYRFRGVEADPVDGEVPIEMRVGVEREDDGVRDASLTNLSVEAVNRTTGERFGPVFVQPESLRPAFASVPAAAAAGGDFDLVLRNESRGRFVNVTDASVAVVADRQPFVWNVLKSFAGLWLLCVLVVSVGVFTSTFLSWPIAVVLTVFLLGVRWAVDQVRDVLRPGFSQQVGSDLFSGSAAGAEATTAAVEAVTDTLRLLASLLPDLSPFSTGRFLAAGVSVPWDDLGYALLVTVGFGLPIAVLGYVFLRFKEVAA